MAYITHCGRKAIPTPAEDVALADSKQEVNWLVISTPFMNKKAIKVGAEEVTDTEGTGDGLAIFPDTHAPPFGACDLAEVFINGKAGDVVYWIAGSGTAS